STGTVNRTSSASGRGSAVPATSTSAGSDNATHTCSSGVPFFTAGSQTVTATDTVNSTINGTSNSVTVSAAAATHFTVSAPSSATAGAAFNYTETAVRKIDE